MTLKYRNRLQIVKGILELTKEGQNKTRIMYKCFLSYKQLESYLNILLATECIEYDNKLLVYHITDKGLHKLNALQRLGVLLDI